MESERSALLHPSLDFMAVASLYLISAKRFVNYTHFNENPAAKMANKLCTSVLRFPFVLVLDTYSLFSEMFTHPKASNLFVPLRF